MHRHFKQNASIFYRPNVSYCHQRLLFPKIKNEGLDLKKDILVILAGKHYYEGLIGDYDVKHYQLPYARKAN